MASPSLAAAATSPASSPLTLDPIPLASRPATAAAPRKRPVLLLDHRPHPASPTPPLGSAAAAAAAAAAPQARRRKPHSSSSSARPRWQTALSVAAKNVALLAVLLYLGDLAWRWSHPPPPPPPDRAALDAYTARVAEVEASLARAFRMVQMQVEAVDRKIEGEVGAARGELAALLEEKRLALEGQLTRLDARADELGDALRGLKRMEFLRKDEFEKFWDEVKGSLGSGSGSDVDLDQVRALAREIAMWEIEKHAADGIGRVDYAVASAGGRVVRHSEAYVAKRGGILSGLLGGGNADPQKMLQPSFGEPGQCFAMQGSSGFVEIKLKIGIIPEAVTLEHVSKDVAYDRSTAPKDFHVSGWYEETPGETQSSHAAKMAVLTEFTYDLEKNNVQTFDVTAPDVGVINMVRLDFTSNHGSSLLTCIYRVRVHGLEPVSPGSAGSQA
ncbi:SUN domain-containing protein 1-like [Phragmites australis]|uniref:SUN domain-containing protein 1-like n=1 Tax=Phragmites australis TaxID=29695 RepID=UPI002D779EC2|nr:SUN domain-containing protein 1-like [Phragmites australis]